MRAFLFPMLNNTPSCGYATFCLSIHQWAYLLPPFGCCKQRCFLALVYQSPCTPAFSSCEIDPEMKLLDHLGFCVKFLRKHRPARHPGTQTNSVKGSSFPPPLRRLVFSFHLDSGHRTGQDAYLEISENRRVSYSLKIWYFLASMDNSMG